jgi:hypothetical protein
MKQRVFDVTVLTVLKVGLSIHPSRYSGYSRSN